MPAPGAAPIHEAASLHIVEAYIVALDFGENLTAPLHGAREEVRPRLRRPRSTPTARSAAKGPPKSLSVAFGLRIERSSTASSAVTLICVVATPLIVASSPDSGGAPVNGDQLLASSHSPEDGLSQM
jgi:hypothetical protein